MKHTRKELGASIKVSTESNADPVAQEVPAEPKRSVAVDTTAAPQPAGDAVDTDDVVIDPRVEVFSRPEAVAAPAGSNPVVMSSGIVRTTSVDPLSKTPVKLGYTFPSVPSKVETTLNGIKRETF